jgi:SAM-dependent methyltransferase
MSSRGSYFEYLRSRKLSGLLYRRYWLYPTLCRYLVGRVLDVGCGLGQLAEFRPNTVGVDIDPAVVAWCRARGLDVSLTTDDVLPFATATFQGVVLDNVLEHILDPAPLLNEIRRVLILRGTLLVGVPGKKGYDSDPDHKVFYDEAMLTETLSKADFKVDTIFHMPFRSAWLDRHVAQYCIFGLFRRG